MKQVNRVQLSFFSIVKIFAIFGVGVSIAVLVMWLVTYFVPVAESNASFIELLVYLALSPLTFILFAVLGYPFFSLVNKYRGGLALTIVKRAIKNGN